MRKTDSEQAIEAHAAQLMKLVKLVLLTLASKLKVTAKTTTPLSFTSARGLTSSRDAFNLIMTVYAGGYIECLLKRGMPLVSLITHL